MIQETANYLQTLRPQVGQFESNKPEIKKFFVERLQELSIESKNDNLTLELCKNLARMSRLLGVLLLFGNTPEEATKYEEFSGVTSCQHQKVGHGDVRAIQKE